MTNQELQKAISVMFQNCIDSYKYGREYGGTELHKNSVKQYNDLVTEQLKRAKHESSDRVPRQRVVISRRSTETGKD